METYLDIEGRVWIRMEEYESILRIAKESKMIIEGIQKSLGVWTTSEALQKIAELQKGEIK